MRISIDIKMPEQMHPVHKARSVQEKVKEAMNNIESDSPHVKEDWAYLRKVLAELQKKRYLSECMQHLLDKIDDFMYKYQKHASEPIED